MIKTEVEIRTKCSGSIELGKLRQAARVGQGEFFFFLTEIVDV